MKKLKTLLILLFAYLFTCLFGQTAHAQEFNVGIYPPIIQINATAPISIKTPFEIQNFSNQSENLNLEMHNFTPSENNDGTINILWNQGLTGTDNNIASKIQIFDDQGNTVTQLNLAPKQARKLFLHVGLPINEPPSDYYFTVVAISKELSSDQNTSSLLQGGIGMNVLLSVGPYKSPRGTLDEFSAPFIIGNGPVPVKILVNNQNSFFINPKGNLVIYDMFNQIVGKVDLLSVNVLANNKRLIPDTKSGSLTNAIWNEKALFGIYRIRLSLLLTPNGPLFQKNIYFIALPIKAVGILIVFLFLTTISVLGIREKLKKH